MGLGLVQSFNHWLCRRISSVPVESAGRVVGPGPHLPVPSNAQTNSGAFLYQVESVLTTVLSLCMYVWPSITVFEPKL